MSKRYIVEYLEQYKDHKPWSIDVIDSDILKEVEDKFIKKCSELANEMFLFEGPITDEIKYSLNKYFNKVEFKWNSIVQDNSIREIYKCYK